MFDDMGCCIRSLFIHEFAIDLRLNCGSHLGCINPLTHQQQTVFENIVEKGDTARNFFDVVKSHNSMESCFHHPLFDLRGTRKVEIWHTNFYFSSKNVTQKSPSF